MNGISPLAQEFVGLRQAMDRLLNDSFVSGPSRTLWSQGRSGNGGPSAPLPLDAYATQDAFVITAAVPGMRPEDLEVTYNNGAVVLAGTIGDAAEAEEAKGAAWYLRELGRGRFQRAVTPPFEVDPGQAEAAFEHGVLRITLPKAAHAKPQKIAVTVGGGAQAIGSGA
jgi:HSP20 family molecular chaperone IbpA